MLERYTQSMNSAQWNQDLRFFADEVQKHHKNPFHFARKEQFRNAVAVLEERIPYLEDYKIIVGLQSLAAMIGDGHTFLATWDIQHFYPLDLHWFRDELRVIRTVPGHQEALGMRLVAINGMNTPDVNARVKSVIPQGENEWYVLQQSANQIIRAEVLASFGILPRLGQAKFSFEDEDSRQFDVDMEPVAPNTKLDWMHVARNPPLYLQRPDEPFWFTTLPDAQTLYINFRSYANVEQHARRLWEFVDKHPPKRLMIDLRQNGGGNYTLGRSELIYEVEKRPALNRPGCLFILIGRGTFSAAMTNATDFRRETDAILVGEPTGARPRGYQENHWLTLPHSGLQVSVASRYYKFQDADMPAVIPSHMVEMDWTDYKDGRDTVIEWILSYTKR